MNIEKKKDKSLKDKNIKLIKLKSIENVKLIKQNLKLSQNYKRPSKTFTDSIQNKESLLEQLKNFIRINNIEDLETGLYVKYITYIKGSHKFRLGGIIIKNEPNYIVLKNNNLVWSVQKYHKNKKDELLFETIFYKKCKENETKKKNKVIINLKKEIELLKKKLNITNIS